MKRYFNRPGMFPPDRIIAFIMTALVVAMVLSMAWKY